MSAIFGIYHLGGNPTDPQTLAQMSSVLRHRGPDAEGVWRCGAVALGHRMLWNTPESLHERLPLANEAGDCVITADARIDNREALISGLRLAPTLSGAITDSELILASYQKWGDRCTEHLLGDFVFAIWDARTQTLFCARDHFGIKPFYYYLAPGLFVFASEIKAILRVAGVPRRLNETRVGDYLVRNFEDKTITFYEGILRLPQAHQLLVSPQGHSIRRYWTPDLAHELRLRSSGEYTEAFREVFTEAVRCRVRSAFPVGSTLSGGLDSSSVACTAAKLLAEEDQELHTFSAIFPTLAKAHPRINERRFMKAVVQMGGIQPHYIHADELSPLVESFWQADEVIVGINLYLDNAFTATAAQHGIRVVLSGHDGDSVVSHGYERLSELARLFKWGSLLRESRALARTHRLRRHSVIWRHAVRPLFQQVTSGISQKWADSRPPAWGAEMAINPSFAQRIELAARVHMLARESNEAAGSVRDQHWAGVNSGLYTYATELLDHVAAPYSVEPRHPFFDKRLVEFCLALPLEQKLQQGWTRAIVRNAMADLLPPEVRLRLWKANLSPNFLWGLLQKEDDKLQEVIFRRPAVLEKYISLDDLHRMYCQFKRQPMRAERQAMIVNGAVLLALWLQNSSLAA